MKKIITLFLVALIFSSCRTNQLFISVQSPAPVTLSNTVKKIGIINRSIPSPDDKSLNAVHEAISGENLAYIKEGSAESIRGLKDALSENARFESVTILDTVKMKATAVGMFPAPLSWEKVEELCKKNNVDAICVLEMFDTELKINPRTIPTNVTTPGQILTAVQQVSINTLVKTGWRIYDPHARLVADEFTMVRNMDFNSTGNPLAIADGLIQRKEYVKQTANLCGHAYSDRILPHWFRVDRVYFIRGAKPDFRIAKRRARAGNWDGAAEIWMKQSKSLKRRAAGRACFNMAVINEINGNLEDALKWAQKSYEDYGIRMALHYIDILKERRREANLLDFQKTQ